MGLIIKYWSVHELKTAREMVEKGHTALEIGRAIGRSKSAVIGYFNRQGLNFARKRGGVAGPNARTKKEKKSPPIVSLLPEEKPKLKPTKTFMEMSDKYCHAIFGDVDGVYTQYCGLNVMKAGCAWCEDHYKLYYMYKKENTNEYKQTNSRNNRLFARPPM
jgi:hypothetical protein